MRSNLRLSSQEGVRNSNSNDVVSLLPAAVYMCDAEGRVTYFNRAAAKLWGREPELGRDLWCGSWRIFHPDGTPLPLDECPMAVTLREGRPVRGEIIIERPDGTRRHIQPHPEPMWVKGPDGWKLVGAVNMLLDITRHKRLEHTLRESRARQKQVIELLPAGVYTCEAPSGAVNFFNQRAAEIWGRSPHLGDESEQFCGSHQLYLPDGQPLPHDQAPMADAIRTGRVTRNREVMIERPDGSRTTVLANIDPIRDTEGRIVGAINVFHDTSELKQAEKDRAHLAAIVHSSDDAIISKTLDGIITSWNTGAERMFGYTADEAIGQSITMLIPPDRLHEERVILDRLARGERVDTFSETVRLHKNGTAIDVSLTVSPIRDSRGRIIGASKIARDITERKRTEQELASYREHLQELVELRTQELVDAQKKLMHSERTVALGTMAAGLGHDIGNLMMPMAVHLEAVQKAVTQMSDSDNLQDRFRAITKSFDYLRKLATGLRMMASTPANNTAAEWRATNLNEWWEDAYPLLKAALTGRYSLEHNFAADSHAVTVPRHLLTQAVFNLVQNASRAMADQTDGCVMVSVSMANRGTMVRLSVSDNGPGMSDEIKRRCTEPFFTTRTRGISTGLGLSLVQGIVQEAGGTLEIESIEGEGSTFTLVLPAKAAQPVSDDTSRPLATVEVQNARRRAMVRHELERMNVIVAESDHVVQSLASGPQLIIIDDRIEAQAAAKALLESDPDSRVIMFTDRHDETLIPVGARRVTALSTDISAGLLRKNLHAIVNEMIG